MSIQLKPLLVSVLLLTSKICSAQELFNFAEPASNMPAHSLGIRLTHNILDEKHLGQTTQQFLPELMWGANKNLMLHLEAICSNSGQSFRPMGVSSYAKYRFLTKDKVHRHFRMAAFARASINKGHVHYQEIETNGMNSGGEIGLIATQLLHKQALSLTLSYEHIENNADGNALHSGNAQNALNYSFSTGRLVLPKRYYSYKQTNFNIMLEVLGQVQPEISGHFVDIAPSLQFIIGSQSRFDIGARYQIAGNISRMAKQGIMLRFEHLLFNVL